MSVQGWKKGLKHSKKQVTRKENRKKNEEGNQASHWILKHHYSNPRERCITRPTRSSIFHIFCCPLKISIHALHRPLSIILFKGS
jgi:hypothetical protein